MKSGKLKKIIFAVLLAPVVAALAFWGYVAYLTSANDTACLSEIPKPVTSDLEFSARLQAVLEEYSKDHNNVGLQATLILPNGRVWDGVSGYANDAQQCPLTFDHQLYVGSVTKTFTSALVMKQVEEGSIRLNDSMGKWISNPNADEITIEMLLRHTSGLPSYTEDAAFLLAYFGRPQKQWQPDELFPVIQDKPLKFEPGSRHEYSNTNFLALGIILEKATGKSYGDLLQSAVTEMGLERVYYPAFSPNLTLASSYDETIFNFGKRNLTGFRASLESGAYSAGGIAASSHDAAFFFHKLFRAEWLAEETVARMMDIMGASDEDVPLQKGYGLGVRNLIIDGESLYGHTGTIPGNSGIAMRNPSKGYTIVVLSNVSTIKQTDIFANLQKIILESLP